MNIQEIRSNMTILDYLVDENLINTYQHEFCLYAVESFNKQVEQKTTMSYSDLGVRVQGGFIDNDNLMNVVIANYDIDMIKTKFKTLNDYTTFEKQICQEMLKKKIQKKQNFNIIIMNLIDMIKYASRDIYGE